VEEIGSGDRLVNLRSLLELLTLVSAHSPHLIESDSGIPLDALQRFWSCSRAQSRLWLAELNAPSDLHCEGTSPGEIDYLTLQRLQPLLTDILVGGAVTRVWGAIVAACDRKTWKQDGIPVAESVLTQHNAVWNRLLQFLVDHRNDAGDEPGRIDQLRRQIERWTDVLVGHLVVRFGVSEFAFDAERARDFGEEQLSENWGRRDLQSWDLYLTCLRTTFPPLRLSRGRLKYLREEQMRQMLSSFPAEVFGDEGTLKPVWLRRLEKGGQIEKAHFATRRRLDERLSS